MDLCILAVRLVICQSCLQPDWPARQSLCHWWGQADRPSCRTFLCCYLVGLSTANYPTAACRIVCAAKRSLVLPFFSFSGWLWCDSGPWGRGYGISDSLDCSGEIPYSRLLGLEWPKARSPDRNGLSCAATTHECRGAEPRHQPETTASRSTPETGRPASEATPHRMRGGAKKKKETTGAGRVERNVTIR